MIAKVKINVVVLLIFPPVGRNLAAIERTLRIERLV